MPVAGVVVDLCVYGWVVFRWMNLEQTDEYIYLIDIQSKAVTSVARTGPGEAAREEPRLEKMWLATGRCGDGCTSTTLCCCCWGVLVPVPPLPVRVAAREGGEMRAPPLAPPALLLKGETASPVPCCCCWCQRYDGGCAGSCCGGLGRLLTVGRLGDWVIG